MCISFVLAEEPRAGNAEWWYVFVQCLKKISLFMYVFMCMHEDLHACTYTVYMSDVYGG